MIILGKKNVSEYLIMTNSNLLGLNNEYLNIYSYTHLKVETDRYWNVLKDIYMYIVYTLKLNSFVLLH